LSDILWVFGMHRSGTSLLMRYLESFGAIFPPNLLPSAPDNPDGFQESQDFVALNEAILHYFNSPWDGTWPLHNYSHSRPTDHLILECKRSLQNWISTVRSAKNFLALKDPRLCRTYHIWHKSQPQNSLNHGVAIIRHPFAVVQSIGYRDDMPAAKALLLWLRHNYELCAHGKTSNYQWPLIIFESLLNEPNIALQAIRAQLNLEKTKDTPDIRSSTTELPNQLDQVPFELQQLAKDFFNAVKCYKFVQEIPITLLSQVENEINNNPRWSYLLLSIETNRRHQLGIALAEQRQKQSKSEIITKELTDYQDIAQAEINKNQPFIQLTNVSIKRALTFMLEEINLNICAGERIALIGANGSGKTSLLRLLSGLYRCSSGNICFHGDPLLPIIEPTLGFSDQLTGRQCCKQNHLLYHQQTIKWLDFLAEIEKFTELGEALNHPIATWSQGMRLRLNFALTTARAPTGLALDEGLAAGDQWFHRKARQRLDQFLDERATVVIASHDIQLLKRYCSRGVILEQGKITYDGSLFRALQLYQAKLQSVGN
jgi:ABC-type polysaccharide/polyol phosphate transport system ATPase subunit